MQTAALGVNVWRGNFPSRTARRVIVLPFLHCRSFNIRSFILRVHGGGVGEVSHHWASRTKNKTKTSLKIHAIVRAERCNRLDVLTIMATITQTIAIPVNLSPTQKKMIALVQAQNVTVENQRKKIKKKNNVQQCLFA